MQIDNPGVGIQSPLLAGVLLGALALPMKRMRDWQGEDTRLAYCFWTLIVLWWLFAFAAVPGLLCALLMAPTPTPAPVFLFGAGWAIACVLLGLAIGMGGLALETHPESSPGNCPLQSRQAELRNLKVPEKIEKALTFIESMI